MTLGPAVSSRQVLLVCACCAAAGALLVAAGLHGYSLPYWHAVIDGSPASEVLLGQPRGVRADDWQTQLPQALGQRAHVPPFPLVNGNVGFGQNMLLPDPMPVAHPATLFRPDQWGFFLSGDVGLAWMWWTRALGVFAVWTALLAGIGGGRLGIAVCGSLAIVASPFLQLWSLVPAPVALYGGLAAVAAAGLLSARSAGAIAGSSLLLGWAGGCFALTLYPPFQIPLAWLLATLLAAWVYEHRGDLPWRERTGARLAGAALALAIAGGAVAALFAGAGDAIATLRATAYPGDRVSTGGEPPLLQLLSADVGLSLHVSDYGGALKNASEASGFLLLSPVVAAALLVRRLARRVRPDAVELALLAAVAGLAVYCAVGVPEWLARATLFSSVPGRRAVFALGLADVLLLVHVLGRDAAPPGGRLAGAIVGLGWAVLLALAARWLAERAPGYDVRAGLAWAAGQGGLAFYLVSGRRRIVPVATVAAAAAVSSLWFNPLVAGGGRYLAENPLARRILAIDRAAGGETVWLAFGPPRVGNLFRAIGVRSLSGVQPVPQFALWEAFDPGGGLRPLYNRYLHPAFFAHDLPDVRMRAVSVDMLFVYVHPEGRALQRLGVTHVLAQGDQSRVVERLTDFEPLGRVGEHHLYRARFPGRPRGD